MESKIYNYNTRKPGGFPNYFKKVGLLLIFVSIISCIVYKFILLKKASSLSSHIFLDLLIIGIFLFSIAKEKLEDERITLIRLKAMAGAFVLAVVYVITHPVFFGIIGDGITDISSTELILNMLFMYNVFFYLQKRADK